MNHAAVDVAAPDPHARVRTSSQETRRMEFMDSIGTVDPTVLRMERQLLSAWYCTRIVHYRGKTTTTLYVSWPREVQSVWIVELENSQYHPAIGTTIGITIGTKLWESQACITHGIVGYRRLRNRDDMQSCWTRRLCIWLEMAAWTTNSKGCGS